MNVKKVVDTFLEIIVLWIKVQNYTIYVEEIDKKNHGSCQGNSYP